MDQTSIIAVIVGVFVVLDRVGLLDRLKLTRPSASAAVSELEIADRKAHRLQVALDAAVARQRVLEQERSLTPVLDLVKSVFETQQQTLEKLSHFNGALKKNEEGLAETIEGLRVTNEGLRGASEGMKALTGTIAELHGLPLTEPQATRRRPT